MSHTHKTLIILPPVHARSLLEAFLLLLLFSDLPDACPCLLVLTVLVPQYNMHRRLDPSTICIEDLTPVQNNYAWKDLRNMRFGFCFGSTAEMIYYSFFLFCRKEGGHWWVSEGTSGLDDTGAYECRWRERAAFNG
jgi:hypothetical protein